MAAEAVVWRRFGSGTGGGRRCHCAASRLPPLPRHRQLLRSPMQHELAAWEPWQRGFLVGRVLQALQAPIVHPRRVSWPTRSDPRAATLRPCPMQAAIRLVPASAASRCCRAAHLIPLAAAALQHCHTSALTPHQTSCTASARGPRALSVGARSTRQREPGRGTGSPSVAARWCIGLHAARCFGEGPGTAGPPPHTASRLQPAACTHVTFSSSLGFAHPARLPALSNCLPLLMWPTGPSEHSEQLG